MSLYTDLIEAGVQVDNHESDLHFQDTETSRAVLSNHPDKWLSARQFINQAPPHVGERWLDVPSAYEPWYEREPNHATT